MILVSLLVVAFVSGFIAIIFNIFSEELTLRTLKDGNKEGTPEQATKGQRVIKYIKTGFAVVAIASLLAALILIGYYIINFRELFFNWPPIPYDFHEYWLPIPKELYDIYTAVG